MVKLTKRKGFNFFRSYYDVYNELETDKDKVKFIDALLDRQFLGIKPTELKGMAKFAYISQTNSIDSQVKGYEDKTGTKLHDPTTPPTVGVNETILTPTEQVQVQEKGKEKEKEKDFISFWTKYPKKVAKDKCKDKFLKLKQTDIDIILNTLDNFLLYKPFEDYTHPNPSTYLNQKRWTDELPEVKQVRKTFSLAEHRKTQGL